MRRPQIAWVLLSLAVGATGASATRLDKIACKDLSTELAGVVAAGARDDMERGPEWAQSSLPPDRLGNIKRLIEIEEQLEFRCGMGHNRIVATPGAEAPEQRADDKAPAPETPMRKPQAKSDAASPPANPSPEALEAAPQKAAAAPARATPAAEAPASAPSVGPVRTVTPAPTTISAVEETTAAVDDANPDIGPPLAAPTADPDIGPPLAAPPADKASPAAIARPISAASPPEVAAAPAKAPPARSSRRTSSAAYVSPSEVNPFFVTGHGDR